MDWTFPKGVAYGTVLGLLLALLALNIAGEFWPAESLMACFSTPPGFALRAVARF